MEPTKHSEWRWFNIDNLPDKIYSPSKKFLAEYVKKNMEKIV